MNKKKNGGYGCGSIIAVLVIFAFLVDVLPVAVALMVIGVVVFVVYKNIIKKKNEKCDTQEDQDKSVNEVKDSLESNHLEENNLKDIVFRKNKLISEQNFDISKKNEIINGLNRKIKENEETCRKLLLEKDNLIFKQKSNISIAEKTIQELQKQLEETRRKNIEESNGKYIKIEDLDPYTWEAALSIIQNEKCYTHMIQRRFGVGFDRALRIINELYMIGIVGESKEGGFRNILVDKYRISEIYQKLNEGSIEKKHVCEECTKKDFIIYELNEQISKLKEHLNDKEVSEKELEKTIENLNKEIGAVDGEFSERKIRLEKEFQEKYSEYEEIKKDIQAEIESAQMELDTLNDEAIEKYYIFSEYDDMTSQDCKNKLSILREREKILRRRKGDVEYSYGFKNKNAESKITRQMLRNFNADCDNITKSIGISNIDKIRNRIQKSYETINFLYSDYCASITEEMLSLKLEQATLIYTAELKKQQEREIQKAIKEQMIEEAREQKEIEEQKKKIEKDLQQHLGEINRMMKYMQKAQADVERQIYIDKIKELEDKIKILETDKETVLEREANAKAGFVYIISNIGSFGEGIYKIGMTRRLEPMDRIRELSSASVPFEFDVHAMIFSSDAPELETTLHRRFADRAVNKVNPRKEFYNVDIDEIEKVVKENYNDAVQFTKMPIATEYRQSLSLMDKE